MVSAWRLRELLGPRAQLYLSSPREYVETKQRAVNTINISPLAYSAAAGLGKLQIELRDSRTCTQECQGLNTFVALPLTLLLLQMAGWKVLGFVWAVGDRSFSPAKHLRNPSYLDGNCVSAGTSLASHSVIRKMIF